MKLFVIPKGSKFVVNDDKDKRLYTVKKKAFGNKFVLLDQNEYELYSLEQTENGKKPIFEIVLNDSSFLFMRCLSVFLDPSFECYGNGMNFLLKSKDRKNFEMVKDGHNVGYMKTVTMMTGELQYEIEIQNIDFDDYIPLFAIAIDKAFGDINKSK